MMIEKLIIENFKVFKDKFIINFKKDLNIIVGNNEEGKSTILEAINLALTGMIAGRYIRNELSQYLFNIESIKKYIESLKSESPLPPPFIMIEVYLSGDNLAELEGNGNSEKSNSCGLSLKIEFDDKYQSEYAMLIKEDDLHSIPIEYYHIQWTSFSRNSIATSRSVPLKPAFIDSAGTRYRNGSDIYINHIIKQFLEPAEIVDISQAHRKMKDSFATHPSIEPINQKISQAAKISNKKVTISAELGTSNAWENSLTTYIEDVPFQHIGKGEQCVIKTNLSLSHNKAKEANLLLMEEPENHLSHSTLNELTKNIQTSGKSKQIIITTHSSFVANKLGLSNLLLLSNKKITTLYDLKPETHNFFKKVSGYDTLRLVLCKKAILVEGDSDELIVQKTYLQKYNVLPIEHGIDILSVGISFLRYIEIADKLCKKVTVVTDNDGDIDAIKKKYKDYLSEKPHISICYDQSIDTGNLVINKKKFNYNTLEPKLVKANSLEVMNKILGTTYLNTDDLHKHMKSHKTECALKFFETEESYNTPQYIQEAIDK